jgi:hypothetical protein
VSLLSRFVPSSRESVADHLAFHGTADTFRVDVDLRLDAR